MSHITDYIGRVLDYALEGAEHINKGNPLAGVVELYDTIGATYDQPEHNKARPDRQTNDELQETTFDVSDPEDFFTAQQLYSDSELEQLLE
jgi:5-deoxy-D-glucuronate isomerase